MSRVPTRTENEPVKSSTIAEEDEQDAVKVAAAGSAEALGRINLGLGALLVALGTARGDAQWYAPTSRLQLVCLDLCAAWRELLWPRVIVTAETPRWLWLRQEKIRVQGASASRVPALRVHTITWKMSVACISETGEDDGLEEEAFSGGARSLEFVERRTLFPETEWWFATLRKLKLGRGFNSLVDGVLWPTSLEELKFGWDFNQPVDNVRWPASLRQLTFGYCFDQPIDKVTWPELLQEMTLGLRFNQRLDEVDWPTSLRKLSFGKRFNQPIAGVAWPRSLQQLSFGWDFNQPIVGATWPPSLEQLAFGQDFNQQIDGVTWPAALQELIFGESFNQPVHKVAWPDSLRRITFGKDFDQPMDALQDRGIKVTILRCC